MRNLWRFYETEKEKKERKKLKKKKKKINDRLIKDITIREVKALLKNNKKKIIINRKE